MVDVTQDSTTLTTMSKYANDGTYKVSCPVCGFNFYSDEMVRRWDDVYVDKKCWEPRHPMDLFQVKPEDNNLPFAKPEGTHSEVDTSGWANTINVGQRGESF